MGNKTIYVKDEALWERARKLAGKEGLSALTSEALTAFVERRENESFGFPAQDIRVDVGQGIGGTAVRFFGRRVADTIIGRGPDKPDAIAEVFQTKAGNFVVILRDERTNEAYDFYKHSTLENLKESAWFDQVPDPDEFLHRIAEAAAEKTVVWID